MRAQCSVGDRPKSSRRAGSLLEMCCWWSEGFSDHQKGTRLLALFPVLTSAHGGLERERSEPPPRVSCGFTLWSVRYLPIVCKRTGPGQRRRSGCRDALK